MNNSYVRRSIFFPKKAVCGKPFGSISFSSSSKLQYRRHSVKDLRACIALLQACANGRNPIRGKQIHSFMLTNGFLNSPPAITSLINMYSKCGLMNDAVSVFDNRYDEDRNVFAYNALIAGFLANERSRDGLEFYRRMREVGFAVVPDKFTFPCVIRACCDLMEVLEMYVVLTYSSTTRLSEILQHNVAVSSSRKSVCGFRTFCTGQDLSTKKCVPCNSRDLRPMTKEAANDLIQKVDGWNLINEDGKLKLNRSWKLKSFTKGLELFRLVADVAEAEGHHPDLHLVGWNNVTIEIWTHAVGGLTENDFILAAKINKLDLQHLLRRKVSS
ncbi:Transcriptional coactivator/pterin dehydratase [Trema orientale]|uniref:4a-hydroxytetrahydrobiopterin dehydratase n=1 Tax=Trema orientale TaxID=63057 RepID=A0A2P5DL68_TREOI|nr:Transcriptional coactivator/pterin dehydratase [Trema orientale]